VGFQCHASRKPGVSGQREQGDPSRGHQAGSLSSATGAMVVEIDRAGFEALEHRAGDVHEVM
jgi:hypothetical protein